MYGYSSQGAFVVLQRSLLDRAVGAEGARHTRNGTIAPVGPWRDAPDGSPHVARERRKRPPGPGAGRRTGRGLEVTRGPSRPSYAPVEANGPRVKECKKPIS